MLVPKEPNAKCLYCMFCDCQIAFTTHYKLNESVFMLNSSLTSLKNKQSCTPRISDFLMIRMS